MKPYIFFVALLAFSCKKELIDDPAQYSMVYMPQAIDYPAVRTTVMTDSLQSIIVGAAFGGVDDPPAASVTLSVNSALVDTFNNKNGTSYPMMPAGSYQLEKTETGIGDPVRLSIKTVGSLEASKEYLLPVSIASTERINEKLRTTYFLIKAEFLEFNRASWVLLQKSSEESPNLAVNTLDNNFTTQWHTQWRNAKPPHPHYLTIDMKETKSVHGFYFWPSNVATGNPQKVHVEYSTDNINWTTTGTYTFENLYKKFPFYLNSTVQARYFKFVVDSSFSNTHFTHLQEVGAF